MSSDPFLFGRDFDEAVAAGGADQVAGALGLHQFGPAAIKQLGGAIPPQGRARVIGIGQLNRHGRGIGMTEAGQFA